MSGCKVADGNGSMLVGLRPSFSCSIAELISPEIVVILFHLCDMYVIFFPVRLLVLESTLNGDC